VNPRAAVVVNPRAAVVVNPRAAVVVNPRAAVVVNPRKPVVPMRAGLLAVDDPWTTEGFVVGVWAQVRSFEFLPFGA
jgi:hypothetical protein